MGDNVAEALVLEFAGIGEREYHAVNKELGIDALTGEGEWPEGLLIHAAGTSDSGTFIVTEVWTSREAQAAFVEKRLGAALAACGISSPPAVTWASVVNYHTLPG